MSKQLNPLVLLGCLVLCGCSTQSSGIKFPYPSEAEKEAARIAIRNETRRILQADEAGLFLEAKRINDALRVWCESIPDARKKRAYLYWVDAWDGIIARDAETAALKASMPVPEGIQ